MRLLDVELGSTIAIYYMYNKSKALILCVYGQDGFT